MVLVLHAGTPHRVSLRGFEHSHPQLTCFYAVLCSRVEQEFRRPGTWTLDRTQIIRA